MKTINTKQLAEILRSVSHAQPIAFVSLTDTKARKTGNPYAQVLKLSRVQAFTGFDYERSVNRQLEREDSQLSFTAKARSWGERIAPALVENAGKLYLVAKIERAAKPVYLVPSGKGLIPVSKATVSPFLPEHKAAQNQGTEKEIVYRNYSLANLVTLSIGGERYRIR